MLIGAGLDGMESNGDGMQKCVIVACMEHLEGLRL